MDYNKIAQDILDNVGGKANVKQVTHCFTRLRFILKDESLAKKDVVEHLEGVISVVVSGGQFQVHWKRNPTTCRLYLGGTFLSVKRLNYRQR